MSNPEASTRGFPCPECQAGICRPQFQTFITFLQADLLAVPGFPVWVCDLCRWREFDSRAVAWLVTLLNPPERRSSKSRRRPFPKDEAGVDRQPRLPK